MTDYIDRQELTARICEDRRPLGWAMLFEHIRNAPTADVAPVVHGRWMDAHGDNQIAECSKCKERYEVTFDEPSSNELFAWFTHFYRYCPNCGARMDGGAVDG